MRHPCAHRAAAVVAAAGELVRTVVPQQPHAEVVLRETWVLRADVPGRTVRFYIQKGLLPGPEGEKRGAYYTDAHLAELLRIRQWQDAGLSLDAIAALLQARSEPPVAPARMRSSSSCSRCSRCSALGWRA